MTWTRRRFLATSGAALAFSAVPRLARSATAAWPGYANAIVIDGLGSPGSSAKEDDAFLSEKEVLDVTTSGLTCLHLTVGAVGTMPSDEAFEQAVASIAHWESEIDRHPTVLTRVRSVDDIRSAKAKRLTGLIYGFQDGVSFETHLDRLAVFHQLGVRVIQPTYNRRNLLGDGCMEPANAGLSRAGHEAVERMNSLGVLVDLSHCGRATAADAIRISKRPVAFTHTGCAAVSDHPRNRTDEELRAVAEKGGVVGIYIMPYLTGGRQPTAADVIRHLDHAVNVAGEDHASIGTDGGLSAVELTPRFKEKFAAEARGRKEAGIAAPGESETGYLFASDLNTPRRLEVLAGMLKQRGYPDSRIQKILGANLVRVFDAAWSGNEHDA